MQPLQVRLVEQALGLEPELYVGDYVIDRLYGDRRPISFSIVSITLNPPEFKDIAPFCYHISHGRATSLRQYLTLVNPPEAT